MTSSDGIVDLHELRESCAGCLLKVLCVPALLDGDDLARLDEVVKRRRPLSGGEILFREGIKHPSLFVVRSGSLKTSTTLLEGDIQILGFHLPGEIIGFDGFADDRHQVTAEALERSSVCELPYAKLDELSRQLPSMHRQITRIVSREFVRTQQHPVMMGRRHAMTRLALFLHSLSERRRHVGQDPSNLYLSMSRQELANYLGLVVETVSRLFSRLQTRRILVVDRKHVRIVDEAALAELAHGEMTDNRELAQA